MKGTSVWTVVIVIAAGLLIGGAAALLLPSPESQSNEQLPSSNTDLSPTPPPSETSPGVGESPVSALATQAAIQRAARPQVGKAAPDFSLLTLEGQEVSITDYLGSPILVNFWATWCPPCRNEMPLLKDAVDKYANEGLVVLAVNATHLDTVEDVKIFIAEFELTFPVLLDEMGRVTDATYQVVNLPSSYFVDREGRIQWVQVGELTRDNLDAALEKILP